MPYGINNDYHDPDIKNMHNYMLDTCIFNVLCDDENALNKLVKSLKYNFEYFHTNIQIRELRGIKDTGTKLDKIKSSELNEKQSKFNEIVKRLGVKKAGHMAALSVNTWVLDGSCHIISEEDGKFVESIKFGNMKHNEDMIIAESVIRKGCILVTNDKALIRRMKRTYHDRVISLDELIYIIGGEE